MGFAVTAHAVTSDGTFIYSASGAVAPVGAILNVFQRYDPVANSWTMLADVPIGVAAGTLAYDAAGGRLFLFGGVSAGTAQAMVQVYTINTGTWTSGPSMPGPRYGMGSGVIGGLIYLAGGQDTFPPTVPQDQTWEFDPAAGTYKTRAVLPSAKASLGSVSGGRLYLMGGADAANPALDTNYEYTPPTDTWATKAALPTAVATSGGTTLGAMTPECDGDILVAGGLTAGGQPTAITQIYDVATNTWGPGPTLPTARFGLRAAQAGNTPFATLIVFGGYNGTSAVTTVDRIQGPPLPVELGGFRVE
jgi:N-acetylneuraminic acid mutarotase